METNDTYELKLQAITSAEYESQRDNYEDYKKAVLPLLKSRSLYVFEDELEQEEPEDMTNTDNFIPTEIMQRNKKGKIAKAWYFLWSDYIILPGDANYDFLFACKLRNLDLLEVDPFLNYHLEKYNENDVKKFTRFLQLVLRKHGKKLLPADHSETVVEWIFEQGKEVSEKGHTAKTKGKFKRDRNDNKTKLNQEQTALLIQFLQSEDIILKGENLKNKDAGEAFSILTGYSADNLRQSLTKNEIERIATKKNLTELHSKIVKLGILINKEIGKKGKPSDPS